jgi:hypothetical protein
LIFGNVLGLAEEKKQEAPPPPDPVFDNPEDAVGVL